MKQPRLCNGFAMGRDTLGRDRVSLHQLAFNSVVMNFVKSYVMSMRFL